MTEVRASAFFFILAACFLASCSQGKEVLDQPTKIADSPGYFYSVFQNVDGTFGYDVFGSDSVKLIHQPVIPAISGNAGFRTSDLAAKVAGEVIEKLKSGELPPTLTQDEIRKILK